MRRRYNEWKDIQLNNKKGLKDWRELHGLNFNEQVKAPYLLTFTRKIRLPTATQEKVGYHKWVYHGSLGENLQYKWYLGAGIHAYGIALLAAEQGMYASFCKCFTKLPNLYSKCMEDVYKDVSSQDDVVYLGLGYRDYRVAHWVDKNKASKDEYMTWM